MLGPRCPLAYFFYRHRVIETAGYLRQAKSLMSDAQREAVVAMIAAEPSSGDVMTGTGGFRKIRFVLEGCGKSGDARVLLLLRRCGFSFERRCSMLRITRHGAGRAPVGAPRI